MKKSSVFYLVLLFFLASCGEKPLYEKAYSFKNREWKQDVKPVYNVEIADVKKAYSFTLSLRTTTNYKYSNLWIFMKTESPDGTIAREPFEIMITEENGTWIGNKTGSVVETSLYFKKRTLPITGKYSFTIEQAITASTIDEVLDIGFTVTKEK